MSSVAWLFAVAVVVWLPSQADAGDLPLIDKGRSSYRIVVAEDATAAEMHAANVLSDTLAHVAGVRLPVVSGEASGPSVYVGRAALAHLNGGSDSPRGDGYRWMTRGDDLFLTGSAEGSDRGTIYAVYHFLSEYAGVQWHMPHRPLLPKRRRIIVPMLDERFEPRFRYREVFTRIADTGEWAAQNRLNGAFGHRLDKGVLTPSLGGARAIYELSTTKLVPRERYGKTHPEYFGGGQLKFSHPDVRRIALENLRARLEKWSERQPFYLLIAHADRDTYFRGAPDRALIQRHGAPGAAYFHFVRDLAEAIEADYPAVTVLAQAYLWSRQPPRAMRFPDNMGVFFAGIERDLSKPYDAPENEPVWRDLKGWSDVTRRILVWDYITNFAGYLQPFPNLEGLGPTVKALASVDAIEGVFFQGAYQSRGAAFAELKVWLLGKLLWNPKADAGALIQQFVAGFYGPAGTYIHDYIELLETAHSTSGEPLRVKTPATAAYLNPQVLAEADRLMDEAMAAVREDAVYRRRVEAVRMQVDYAILVSRSADRIGSASRATRLERFERALKRSGVTAWREGHGDVEALLTRLRLPRREGSPPSECARKQCVVVEDAHLHLAGPARVVSDARATDGGSAMQPGDSNTWGVQLPLDQLLPSDGRWRIHLRLRADPVDDATKEDAAIAMGVYPGVKDVIRVADIGTEYRSIRIPGRWAADPGRYLWVAPVRGHIDAVYVDRVYAIREDGT